MDSETPKAVTKKSHNRPEERLSSQPSNGRRVWSATKRTGSIAKKAVVDFVEDRRTPVWDATKRVGSVAKKAVADVAVDRGTRVWNTTKRAWRITEQAAGVLGEGIHNRSTESRRESGRLYEHLLRHSAVPHNADDRMLSRREFHQLYRDIRFGDPDLQKRKDPRLLEDFKVLEGFLTGITAVRLRIQ